MLTRVGKREHSLLLLCTYAYTAAADSNVVILGSSSGNLSTKKENLLIRKQQ